MSNSSQIVQKVICQPGITTRFDSTAFDAQTFIDGEHTRFYRSKPKKIGGRLAVEMGNKIIARTLLTQTNNDKTITVFAGREDSLTKFTVSIEGAATPEINRTPAEFNDPGPPGTEAKNRVWDLIMFNGVYTGYTPPSWNDWFQRGVSQTYIIGLAPYVLNDIADPTQVTVYFGPLSTDPNNAINSERLIALGTYNSQPTNPLVPPPLIPSNTVLGQSGGILSLDQYLLVFGSDGTVRWNGVNVDGISDFSYWPFQNLKTFGNTKLVAATTTLGGQTACALFWSLDTLYRAILQPLPFVTETSTTPPLETTTKFLGRVPITFATVQSGISILSSNAVLQYDQDIIWPGTNTFYSYVGIVQTVPNNEVHNFFFSNLNYKHQQKVFGVVLQRYNELWWMWPNRLAPGGEDEPGKEAECNWAIVYNKKEQRWFHTPWNRAAAIVPGNSPYPIMSSSQFKTTSTNQDVYPIWFEEYKFDEFFENDVTPIKASFQTNLFSFFQTNPEADYQMQAVRFEPDFVQAGAMTLEVSTQKYVTDSPTNFSEPYTFFPETGKIDIREMGRLMSFRFTSNALGGDFQMGVPVITVQPGDERP
jgi:hypothetical protein